MRGSLPHFILDEDSGAVTVDWVVLSAVVTALGVGVVAQFLQEETIIGSTAVQAMNSGIAD